MVGRKKKDAPAGNLVDVTLCGAITLDLDQITRLVHRPSLTEVSVEELSVGTIEEMLSTGDFMIYGPDVFTGAVVESGDFDHEDV